MSNETPQTKNQPSSQDKMKNKILIDFVQCFNEMGAQYWPESLDKIYAPEIVFEDPFHRFDNFEKLKAYFAKMNPNVKSMNFEVIRCIENQNTACIEWIMHLELKTPKNFKMQLPGSSVLEFNEKIHFHRDYFDAGQFLYEKIPGIGSLIRLIKKNFVK